MWCGKYDAMLFYSYDTSMAVTTWLLARARAYILAVASKLEQDVAISLDVSSLHADAASLAWLREVPAEYSSSMPISGRWLAYCDQEVITYYRGSLADATMYSMHICKGFRESA
jgi:hypothetical protein